MTVIPAFLLQDDSGAAGAALLGIGAVVMLVMLVFAAIALIGFWKVFTKAGQPGWAVLIPIYNIYILLKIAGRPGWWVILLLIPLVNLVIAILVSIDVAKAFGRSPAFGVIMLCFLGGIGYLILGFGKSQYLGVAAAQTH